MTSTKTTGESSKAGPPLPKLDIPPGTPWLGWKQSAYTPQAIEAENKRRAEVAAAPKTVILSGRNIVSTPAARDAPGQNLGAGIGEITATGITGVNVRKG